MLPGTLQRIQLLTLYNYDSILAETTADMKRKDLMEVLVKILSTEEQVEILDEAAFAIANISKECMQ